MRKIFLLIALLAVCAALAFSQADRPRVAILPFTGGTGGDGDAIVTFLSMQPAMAAFTLLSRTPALYALFDEHYHQLAGFTDSYTIRKMGNVVNADYVLSGSIREMDGMNLVIATIINIRTFEQVAGYHLTYRVIEEVLGFLPSMAESMVDTALRNTSGLPNLAILPPFEVEGIDFDDADTLSKILAIEIINTGSYAVLPRNSVIESAVAEYGFGAMGFTTEERRAILGRGANPQYVLSVRVNTLGGSNWFTAQVLNFYTWEVRTNTGGFREFQALADGRHIMTELAPLTDPAHVHVRNGKRHLQRGEYNQAGEAFQTALGIVPNHIRATELLRRAQAGAAQNLSELQRLELEERNRRVQEHIGRGNLYAIDGRLQQAENSFSEALRIDPGNLTASLRLREVEGQRARLAQAAQHINRGNEYMSRREFELAYGAFNAALQVVPNHPTATQRREDAIRAQADAVASTFIANGNNYLARNRFRRARRAFEAAQQAVPNNAAARHGITDTENRRDEHFRLRFWSVGVSLGTAFAEPWAIGTVQVTLAPFPRSFLRIGGDFGFISGVEGVSYSLTSPFAHYAFFAPIGRHGGWYIGAGGGVLWEQYRFEDIDYTITRDMIPTVDFTTGFILGNRIDISYTLRITDVPTFSSPIHKLSVGFTQRFFQPTRRQN